MTIFSVRLLLAGSGERSVLLAMLACMGLLQIGLLNA